MKNIKILDAFSHANAPIYQPADSSQPFSILIQLPIFETGAR